MKIEIDGFTDVTPLAGGGFGSVYKATRVSTGGTVAVKVLDRSHRDDEALLERRLRREIAALVALKGHPNVVQVEEVVSTSGGPAIVMEFMASGSILDTDEAGAVKASRVAFIGAGVASGLHAAHEAGIVHRDVKPQNVLVNAFGQIKLCDFGIAAIQRADMMSRTNAMSVRYASPEELDSAPDVGAPTDVYSLGATLFHLMYGDPPSFQGRKGADPALTRSQRGQSKEIDRVSMLIENCLEHDPADRPTANECFGLLSNLELDASIARRKGPKESPIATRRRRRAQELDDVTAEKPDRSQNRSETDSAPRRTDPNRRAPLPPTPPTTDPSGAQKRLPPTSTERWWT